jgi:hypothetical protein
MIEMSNSWQVYESICIRRWGHNCFLVQHFNYKLMAQQKGQWVVEPILWKLCECWLIRLGGTFRPGRVLLQLHDAFGDKDVSIWINIRKRS